MTNKIIEKDERTTFIENKSFKYGYNILSFGILIDMIYRDIWLHQSSGDLFLLVVITGFIVALYQYRQKMFSKTWLKKGTVILAICFVSAFLLAFVLKRFLK